MNFYTSIRALLFLLLILTCNGCYTYHHVPLKKRIQDTAVNKPSTIKTKDNHTYKFEKYSISDSTLLGITNNRDSVKIHLRNIKDIEVKSNMTSMQKGVFGIAVTSMSLFLLLLYSLRDFRM